MFLGYDVSANGDFPEASRPAAAIVDAVRQLHVQHLRVAGHAPEVLGHLEDVHPPLTLAPVRADSLEASGAVVERVREEAEMRVAVAAQLAVEVHGPDRPETRDRVPERRADREDVAGQPARPDLREHGQRGIQRPDARPNLRL